MKHQNRKKMKKVAFLLFITSLLTVSSHAQFKKLLKKKGNKDAITKVLTAATLSDADVNAFTKEAIDWMDKNNAAFPEGSVYEKRLAEIVAGFKDLEGISMDFGGYWVKSPINAFAMGTPQKGYTRILSPLMDVMDNDQVTAVVAHEICHVKKEHSKKGIKKAYMRSATKDVLVANTGNTGEFLNDTGLSNFTENYFGAVSSRTQESEADKCAFGLLVKNKLNYHALAGAFEVLKKLSGDGGKGSIMSSHPATDDRVERAKKWAKEQDEKSK